MGKTTNTLAELPASATRAVSIEFLMEFTKQNNLWDKKTYEVVQQVIVPQTMEKKCRYTELLDKNEVGKLKCFISHAWGNSWGLLVTAVVDWAKRSGASTNSKVWVDVFAVNQHVDGHEAGETAGQQEQDLSELYRVAQGGVGFLLVADPLLAPLRRAWCLYEIISWIEGRAKGFVLLAGDVDDHHSFVPADHKLLSDAFFNVDMAQAEAQFQQDKDMIFARVEKKIEGGFRTVNEKVKEVIRQTDVFNIMNTCHELGAGASVQCKEQSSSSEVGEKKVKKAAKKKGLCAMYAEMELL